MKYITTPARLEAGSEGDAVNEQYREMAIAVRSRGELRHYLPSSPLWDRRIGDDALQSINTNGQLHRYEEEMLVGAHAVALTRRKAVREAVGERPHGGKTIDRRPGLGRADGNPEQLVDGRGP